MGIIPTFVFCGSVFQDNAAVDAAWGTEMSKPNHNGLVGFFVSEHPHSADMLPTVKSLFLKIQCMNTSFFHGAGFAPSPRKTCRKGILHRFPNDLTGAGCAADGIHRSSLVLQHLVKNRFRRSPSSVFVL